MFVQESELRDESVAAAGERGRAVRGQMVEFGQAFLWQHTAVYLRYNDPSTAIYPGFHYACLFALYGAFLLVNFAELWQVRLDPCTPL
eukprot:2218888-Rhodomonas_salina.1